MNIAIIGGGNMGSVLATKFSQQNNVNLYISNRNGEIDQYLHNMQSINEDSQIITTAKIAKITDSLKDAIDGAEYIFITYPHFLLEKLSKEMLPLLKNQNLIFIPGSGGAELWFKPCIEHGCTISGLQRVHAVTRIIEKGRLTRESGVRAFLKSATIPAKHSHSISIVLSQLYNMDVEVLDNYANITLINSNAILHTSRLYCLFKDYNKDIVYKSLPLFYEEWDIDSAQLLVDMDNELKTILDYLSQCGMNMSGIIPLLEHYESTNIYELKNKLTSINSFKGLKTPSIRLEEGYIPDFDSRYFTSDFPYGLDLILSFAKVCNIDCPNMLMVSNWYHNLSGTDNAFDLRKFDINTPNDIIGFYKNK